MSAKILFVDRDGTLIEEPADFQIDSVEKFRLLPGVIAALQALVAAGYRLVMVSNQDGLGTPGYPQASFDQVQGLLLGILESQGIHFEEILICPHFDHEGCACRKPRLGLLNRYLADSTWDRQRSAVIGDRPTDEALAANLGVAALRIGPDYGWRQLTRELIDQPRTASCRRHTQETQIEVAVDLDGGTHSEISTGIGFFDHMLDQIGRHAGIGLRIAVRGDTHIDDHHTVEDTAIALGTALRQALGDKRGIGRFGFYLPMDDSSAQVALDLSGRTFAKWAGQFPRDKVGELSTEMVPHFFRSLAEGLQANLHIAVQGDNTHHMVEAAFKAVGRSLRQAVARSDGSAIPSTKGVL